MREPKNISFDELMNNLDQHRKSRIDGVITKQQFKFIKKCREGSKRVPFREMVLLWEKAGWGKTCETTMKRRADEIKTGRVKVE